MRCPFPGMDPWLEEPLLWPGVHQGLIACLRARLNEVLPADHVADIGERLYVVESDCPIYPDALVMKGPARSDQTPEPCPDVDPPLVVAVEPIELRETFIEIRALRGSEKVVTVIEVLSPSNKIPEFEGQTLYRSKQKEVLGSRVHLLEIDLLRSGEHTVAVPRKALRARRGSKWDYLVCLHRGGEGRRYEVWALTVRERLPRVRVPLSEGTADVALDLESIFERTHREGAYARRLDYSVPPVPPLGQKDKTWAAEVLRGGSTG